MHMNAVINHLFKQAQKRKHLAQMLKQHHKTVCPESTDLRRPWSPSRKSDSSHITDILLFHGRM
jgi:hypothetical protein